MKRPTLGNWWLLIAWSLLGPLAATWAWESGKPISPAQFPRKPTIKTEKLPDGGFVIHYKDGSRVWVEHRSAKPLYFESGEQLPNHAIPNSQPADGTAELRENSRTKPESPGAEPASATQTAPLRNDQIAPQAALKIRWVFHPETRRVRSLAFTTDDRQLAVGLDERKVLLCDLKTGDLTREIANVYGPAELLIPARNPNSMYVAEGPFLRLTDLVANKDLHTLGINSGASANGFLSAGDSSLVLASAAGGVEFVTHDLRESTRTLVPSELPKKGSDIKSSAAAYDNRAKLVASGRPNGRIYVWSVQRAEPVEIAKTQGHSKQVDGLQFVNGKLLSLGRDGFIKMWDPQSLQVVGSVSLDSELRRGWFLGNGRYLATIATKTGSPLLLRTITVRDDQLQLSVVGEIPSNLSTMKDETASPAPSQIVVAALSSKETFLALAFQQEAAVSHSTRLVIVDLPQDLVVNADDTKKNATGKAEFRIWSSKDGRFRVEAKLVSVEGPKIQLLRRDNGKVISVSSEQLSADDQAFVGKWRP